MESQKFMSDTEQGQKLKLVIEKQLPFLFLYELSGEIYCTQILTSQIPFQMVACHFAAEEVQLFP